ncbi:DUF4267 domain-containing protein [Hymenobacter crusticola]|uniref:Uncharacterized protein n=1 Tax=Hymenobacter crusticola TaxID=1770526 RepID=A0A2C9ZU47_9BACT|nr:DUF4267 domain-containing protein [Hymenobacter crusticola]OUJ70458.1 hypothetical protein BXP70_24160 [Hymenobacter crusticola]
MAGAFYWSRTGAKGFGVFLPPTDTQYAFHYAKGIRNVFSGLLLALFTGLGYDRPLAWVLLLGTLIPCVNLTVAQAQPTAPLTLQMPHLLTIVLLLGLMASFIIMPHPATLAVAQFGLSLRSRLPSTHHEPVLLCQADGAGLTQQRRRVWHRRLRRPPCSAAG